MEKSKEKEHGCKHYTRSCMLIAVCCKRTYPCRICHDENETHKIDRYSTKEMICLYCGTIQDVSQSCIKCKQIMASYYCSICKLWCSNGDFFHCDKCNLCRIGKKENFFHCKVCNACMDIQLQNNHMHIENTLKSDCPICAEYLFTSVKEILFLKCGHSMHLECYDYYINRNFQCPICMKNMGDMKIYDQKVDYLLKETINIQKQKGIWFCDISCYDCRNESKTQYRYLFNKCENCKSYNTRLNEIHKNEKSK